MILDSALLKMIIDFHTHIGKGDPFYHSTIEEEQLHIKPEKLLSEMDRCNVSKSVVIPAFRLSHRLIEANHQLAAFIKNFRNKLFAFAWLDPRIEGVCQHLDDLVRQYGFKGLKLHPVLNGYYLTNESINPLIEKCIDLRIPVLTHTGWGSLGSVNLVDKLANRYPKAKIVIAHMIEPTCVDVAKKNENVFIETSYATHPRRITQAIKAIGADKLIYGSDFPMGGGMEFEISKIMLAKINKEEKERILFRNAIELLKINI